MIRDLMIVVDGVGRRALPCGLALAAETGASVTAAGVLPAVPFETYAQAEIRYDMIVSAERSSRERAAEAAEEAAAAARGAGLSCESVVICSSAPEAAQELAERARLCDLVVIEQADHAAPKPADAQMEPLLFRSGRPVLIVPYIQAAPPALTSAVVAWDGSAQAARALADALPLLRRANRVEVVTVAEEPTPEDLPRRMVRHLARHGVDATFRVVRAGIPPAEALLSHVADCGADLLVMGAYGHARLREALIGGTSRTMLRSMTVPVLMSR
ncbi:UspA domain protein [Methylobacterium sp. 4-46]|uniref:universal stress protein n=1 Tax=unclassified Methylobacterium TaxID=2615210 RepID=UPI000152CCA7|nr:MULTISPECIES: universal stress protein [Methylobacterium]ACA20379.1 UspA domain protein [Methylobacterium sp. 4-46]WFT79547.1 universal stress protein [Methylobacterium nodulans]